MAEEGFKLPPIEDNFEEFKRDASLIDGIDMDSFLSGAEIYHEFIERKLISAYSKKIEV